MYFPTTRVLTVLELLQSRQQISGPELATRLEVDTRTVRRYITMLQDLGVPVEAERGRYGAYRLRPGFKLPPLMFTDEEALALTLGLLAARKLGLTMAAPAVEGALAKIERVLPIALRKRVQAVQETLVFDFVPAGTVPDNEIVVTLCAAAQQMQSAYMSYRAWGAREDSKRMVDPYGLVFRAGCWYMVGYCHLRKQLRTFRLDRIVSVELSPATFERPLNFDSVAYVIQSIAQTPNTWYVDVLLKLSWEEALCRVPPALALLEEVEGGISFRCYVSSLEWIAHVIAGLNCQIEIRQPQELRAAMHRLADRIHSLAESH